MNTLSLSNSLVMKFLRDVFGMDAHVLLDTATSHCYLNSSYARRIGLHVKENIHHMLNV
jgi:predicted aspartyl protease